jgi:hypothetical protein
MGLALYIYTWRLQDVYFRLCNITYQTWAYAVYGSFKKQYAVYSL